MDTYTIYRVEDSKGNGPFTKISQTEQQRNILLHHVADYTVHPLAPHDCGYRNASDIPFCMVCGCESLDILKHWFPTPDVITVLEELEMKINVYVVESSDVRVSKSGLQVMFSSNDGVIVDELPISALAA